MGRPDYPEVWTGMDRAALDPLVVGRVIGDVLDMFVPAAELAVQYGGKEIGNGSEVKPSSAAEPPRVHIRGSANNYYTLEMMPYMGPQPPTGIHRYVFAAFRQHGVMETVARRPVERGHFNTRRFASENELGLPAAALYFNSQKQPAAGNKKR
ncbi:hypothetical protein DH2020_017362 [Rehmannia glutinosa]|uniref:PEBP-like protein n=1 Tax=Rehmannia glutinosa TaxID=99300 RepID=A0ABR0WQN7_REHGL